MPIRIYLEIGHEAVIRTKRTLEGFTHDWKVFVRGCDNADIHYYIDRVVFHLHETFPKPKRVLKDPPYVVKESGYAGFNMPIDIYLRNKDEPKRIRFNYDLQLQPTGPAISNVQKEKYVFSAPSEDFSHKLLKGGGLILPPNADNSSSNQEAGFGHGDGKAPLLSKPKLAGATAALAAAPGFDKKHKAKEYKLEEPKMVMTNSFAELFGPPITKTSKVSPDPKQQQQAKMLLLSGAKAERAAPKAAKHSPHKERDAKRDGEKRPKEEAKKAKERRSKEREHSREKVLKKSPRPRGVSPPAAPSPRPSPKRAPSPKRPPSPPTLKKAKCEEKRPPEHDDHKKNHEKKKKDKHDKDKERKEHKVHNSSRGEAKEHKSSSKADKVDKDVARDAMKKEKPLAAGKDDPSKENRRDGDKPKHKHKKKDRDKKDKREEKEPRDAKPERPNKFDKSMFIKEEPKEAPAPAPQQLLHLQQQQQQQQQQTPPPSQQQQQQLSSSSVKVKSEPEKSSSLGALFAEMAERNDSDESSGSHDESSIEVPVAVGGASAGGRANHNSETAAAVKREPDRTPRQDKTKDKAKRAKVKDKDAEKKKKRKSDKSNLESAKEPSPKPAVNNVKVEEEQQQQQQRRRLERRAAPAPPPPPLATPLPTDKSPDYMDILKDLQHKIMTLQDNAELQKVVQLIAETGQYEITTKTFDFDLCALDRSTVQRLQDFFAT